MILEIASAGLIGFVFYTYYYGSLGYSSITDALNERIDNGYQLRDITYQDKPDLMHPDVRNNSYAMVERVATDRGTNGVPREHVQLLPGTSEILQLHRRDNLFI